MPKALKLPALLAVFTAGVLLAWALAAGGQAAVTTTTTTTVPAETTTVPPETTTPAETTVPAETEAEPTTVFTTTTTIVPLPSSVTTVSSEDDATPAWVWALIAILAVGLVVLIVLLARRGGGGGVSVGERQRQLDAAVGSWAAQGWTVVNASADSAVLRRGSDSMIVSVDRAGHVSSRPLPPS